MYTIGIIAIAGNVKTSYIDHLEKNQFKVVRIEKDKLDRSYMADIDGVILYDEDQDNVAEMCSVIIKIKDQHPEMFIWTLSKQTQETNRIICLQLGADGNLHNDYSPDEFYLLLRNILSHKEDKGNYLSSVGELASSAEEGFGQVFKLLPRNQSVVINGEREIELTRLEYKALEILSSQPKRALSSEELYQEIWGETTDNCKPRIANLIFHVRGKIEEDPLGPKFIRTVRSKGYVFNPTI